MTSNELFERTTYETGFLHTYIHRATEGESTVSKNEKISQKLHLFGSRTTFSQQSWNLLLCVQLMQILS